jgi:type I restriction enzyme, S subunit
LIARTVTRGLPPEAAEVVGLEPATDLMRSGIDWAPSIPTSWDAIAIKYVARIESGHTPSRAVEEYWVDCTIPWVSLNDSGYLRIHDVISETYYQISELGMANSSAHLLPECAVVLSRDATVGLCAITTRPMAVSQHFVAYICGPRLVPSFLLLALKAMNQHLERLSLGSTIATIGMADIKSLQIPLPPVHVQNAIVDYVSKEAAKLDQLAAKVEAAVERLTEYRQTLITSAVTGKIDVRGMA